MRHDITERLADLAARRGTLIIDRAAEHVDEVLTDIRNQIGASLNPLRLFQGFLRSEWPGQRQAEQWERDHLAPEIETAAALVGMPTPTNDDELEALSAAVDAMADSLSAEAAEADDIEASSISDGAKA